MSFVFVDISVTKFSINGVELFKTFNPYIVSNTSIKIFNIYDSKHILVPITHVSQFIVDGLSYANSTDLSNALVDVIFSRVISGDINNVQVEQNRLDIVALQTNQVLPTHIHDDRYYTETEIDQFLLSFVSSTNLLGSGVVDGNLIRLFDGNSVEVFTIDAQTFLNQAVSVTFENGILSLRNASGTVLDTVPIEAKETFYDQFQFQNNIADDLTGLVLNEDFTLVRTLSDFYFFVSKASNTENFIDSRLFINDIDSFFDLGLPDQDNATWKAWQITIPSESFISASLNRFNYWQSPKATHYKGGYNVSTNTPNLTNVNGVQGYEYKVTNAASAGTNRDFGAGNILLKNGDIILFDGTVWLRKNENRGIDDVLAIDQTLSINRNIKTGQNILTINADSDLLSLAPGGNVRIESNDDTGTSTRISANPGSVNLEVWASNNRTGLKKSEILTSTTEAVLQYSGVSGIESIRFSSLGIVITDLENSKGAVYAGDYRNNFTERSLIDRGFADVFSKQKRIEVNNVSGNYDIDWSGTDEWDLTLTGNTTFFDDQLPSASFSKSIRIYVTGTFGLTLPVGWTIKSGSYNGALDNRIDVDYIQSGKIWATIQN